VKVLDVRIDSLPEDQLSATIAGILESNRFHHLCTVNPEFLVLSQKNDDFKKCLNASHLNICDGFGITFWTKILYNKNIVRIPGVEVATLVCAQAEKLGKSVYLLGGFGVTPRAIDYLKSQFPTLKIAGHQDGSPEELNQDIIDTQPEIILVAFGAPTQELWLQEYGKKIPSCKLGIGIGGTFDFWSGKVKRAPTLMRKLGIEWLWRLMMEPIKRGKRIYTAVVVFSWLMILERFKLR